MRRGFTLIEILLVAAISVVLLLAAAVPFTQSFQAYATVDGTRAELLEYLRLAQAQSQARLRSAEFGVSLEANRYTRYQGVQYSQRDPTFDEVVALDGGVTLSFRGFSQGAGPIDLHFSGGTGLPSDLGTVVVTHRSGRRAFLAVNSAGLISEAQPGTATYSPDGDATIREDAAWTNDGLDAQLQVYPWEPSNTRRALVRFSLAGIPSGATIQSARLTLRQSQTYGASRTVSIHRVTRSWVELGVSWRNTGAQNWTTPGADFVASATDAEVLQWSGTLGDVMWDVTNDVRAFVDGTALNAGWLLKDASEDGSQAYWFFASREGANPARLEVTYDF